MDATVAVALISIAGTGTVSILTLLIARNGARDRQQQQLDHERHMADLAELRSLLDGAASLTFDFSRTTADTFSALNIWRAAAPEEQADRADAAGTALREPVDVYHNTNQMLAQLVLRLGEEHPVVTRFQEFRHKARELLTSISLDEQPSRRVQETPTWELFEESQTVREEFILQARKIVASRLLQSD